METLKQLINSIPFSPKPRSGRRYGVSIKYFNGEEELPGKRVDYQIQLKIEQYRDLPNTWQFCFNKEDLYIDQHGPDLVAEQLASRAMKVLYPIKVDVNAKNEQIKGIVNHDDMQRRWAVEKQAIRHKYEGDFIELFVGKLDHKFANKGEIEFSMKYDMFWSVFFHPQYFSYGENRMKASFFNFPILPYSTFRFAGEQKLHPDLTDYNTYRSSFESVEELPKELQKFGLHANMKLSAQFDFDPKDGMLKYSVVNWGVYGKENQVCHKKIRFSAYEIDNVQSKVDSPGLINDKESSATSQKKGFWERILG